MYSPAKFGVAILATQIGDAIQDLSGGGPAKSGRLADDVGEIGGGLVVPLCQ